MNTLFSACARRTLLPALLLAVLPGMAVAQAVDPSKATEKAATTAAQSQTARDELRSRRLSAEAFLRESAGAPTTKAGAPPMTKAANVPVEADRRPIKPLELRPMGGIRGAELVLDYEIFKIGNDLVKLRSYNRSLVGPTIRVKAGETLYLTLRNKLPVDRPSFHSMNSYHNWNTTNLHFHGLHVAPQGRRETPDLESDNVLLRLEPVSDPNGSVQRYAVEIPPDHPAGTFWYHPHVHGSTTPQVASGAAGALIIERDDAVTNLDHDPAVREASKAEEILVLQQIPYLMEDNRAYGEIENYICSDSIPSTNKMLDGGAWKTLGRYITVNGRKIPTIRMVPGEVRRFRFIAAQIRDLINLRVERSAGAIGPDLLTFHEIAVDGLPTGDSTPKTNLELYPGYRSDVLIQAPNDPGEYALTDLNAAAGTGLDGSPEALRLVARIVIAGTPVGMKLPAPGDLAGYRPHAPGAPTGPTQYAFYGIVVPEEIDRFSPAFYYVSREYIPPGQSPDSKTGKEFDPRDVRKLTLGMTQKWVVGSRNTKTPEMNIKTIHPFHIHINPFLIQKVENEDGVDVTAAEIGKPTWRDTLAMKQGYSYTLITTYAKFAGKFVEHCHILDHEDHGMMERVDIVDPAAARTAQAEVLESPAKVPVADLAKPTVLLFVKGSTCSHCMAQLNDMGKALGKSTANFVVVSAGGKEDLGDFPRGPFALVADPEHTLFREYGAFKDQPLHATIVLDPAGKTLLKEVGDTPFLDVEAVRRALAR